MKKYAFIKYILLMTLAVAALCLIPREQARADGGALKVDISLDSSYIYQYETEYYLSSAKNTTGVKYVITNTSDAPIKLSAVKIIETLTGTTYSYGNTLYDSSIMEIAPGETLELKGETFTFAAKDDDFMLKYDVQVAYTKENELGYVIPYVEEDFQSILAEGQDGIMYITREKINLSAIYKTVGVTGNLYTGDTVTVQLVLTSDSNVPVRGIKVYDSIYGYLGDLDEVMPGTTVTFTSEIVVMQSTVSSAYITYRSADSYAADVEADFSESKISIAVSFYSYELEFSVLASETYISKNQKVAVTFTIINNGTGDLDNVVVLDGENNRLFSVSLIKKGAKYTKTVEYAFFPNNTYVYNCISPRTEKETAEVSFKSLPGISLSYGFDKGVMEYKYQDTVNVEYIVSNDGSVDAENLVLTDRGQTVKIGRLTSGETNTVTLSFTLSEAENTFAPVLTGNYRDAGKSKINESAASTTLYVAVPESYADVDFSYVITPEIVYNGTEATVTYTITNNGNGDLTSFSMVIVELNKVIASDGVLAPGETKTYSVNILCNSSQSFTFRLLGNHGVTATEYEKINIVRIQTTQNVLATPSPTPEPGTSMTPRPTRTPSAGQPQQNDADYKLMLVLIFTVGTLSVIMVLVTIAVILRRILKK